MTSIRRRDEWPSLNSPKKSSSVHTEVTWLQWICSLHVTIYYLTDRYCNFARRHHTPWIKVKIISILPILSVVFLLIDTLKPTFLGIKVTIHMIILQKITSDHLFSLIKYKTSPDFSKVWHSKVVSEKCRSLWLVKQKLREERCAANWIYNHLI